MEQLELILLKDDGWLVEIKSISDLWVLVKQVSDFTMLVKWKRSQKSLKLFEPAHLHFVYIKVSHNNNVFII